MPFGTPMKVIDRQPANHRVAWSDCLPMSNHATRNPTMKEAIEIVTNCIDRREQIRQLSFMRETQGEAFAQQVGAKVKAAGGVKKK